MTNEMRKLMEAAAIFENDDDEYVSASVIIYHDTFFPGTLYVEDTDAADELLDSALRSIATDTILSRLVDVTSASLSEAGLQDDDRIDADIDTLGTWEEISRLAKQHPGYDEVFSDELINIKFNISSYSEYLSNGEGAGTLVFYK